MNVEQHVYVVTVRFWTDIVQAIRVYANEADAQQFHDDYYRTVLDANATAMRREHFDLFVAKYPWADDPKLTGYDINITEWQSVDVEPIVFQPAA